MKDKYIPMWGIRNNFSEWVSIYLFPYSFVSIINLMSRKRLTWQVKLEYHLKKIILFCFCIFKKEQAYRKKERGKSKKI